MYLKKGTSLFYSSSFFLIAFSMSVGFYGFGGKDSKAPLKAGDLQIERIVDRLQSFYEKTHDFEAEFEQVYRSKYYNEEKKSYGKVYIMRHGKMRWEYKKPGEKLFVADGKYIWVYEKDVKQVVKQPMEESDLPVAVTFLVGKGNLKKDFKARLIPHEKFKKKGKIVIELKPVKENKHYKKLILIVDNEKYIVERTIIVDHAGNTNTMRFKNMKFNQGLSEKLFVFKPPRGSIMIEP